MWNKNQEEYNSPFMNTGERFECPVFQVHAYSWNDKVEQPWNFKYENIEMSWYKYLGRGTTVNKQLLPGEIDEMLNTCLAYLDSLEDI